MKVRVQYLGYIKNMLNKREDQIELKEKASLSELLNKLAEIYGKTFRKDVYEPGMKDVKMGFSVTINGLLMAQLGGIDAKLNEGDNIILMSLMSGG